MLARAARAARGRSQFADGQLAIAFPAAAGFRLRKAEVERATATTRAEARCAPSPACAAARFELREELGAESAPAADEALSEDDLVARFKEEFDAEEIPVERADDD